MKLYISICLSLLLLVLGCQREKDYSLPDGPLITPDSTTYIVDFNKTTTPIIEGTITSGVGLQKVNFFAGSTLIKSITAFTDKYSYDFAEAFSYSTSMTNFIRIIAIDLNGKSNGYKVMLNIIQERTAPVIKFPSDTLAVDPANVPNTKFTITSNAGLKNITYAVMRNDGTTGTPVSQDLDNAPMTYSFDSRIAYNIKLDTALQVTVTDVEGRVTAKRLRLISTIPDPPTVKVTPGYIQADAAGDVGVPLVVQANGGLKSITYYGISKTGEAQVKTASYNGEKTLNSTQTVPLTADVYAVKIVVTDQFDQTVSLQVVASIGLKYIENYVTGTQHFAAGHTASPNTYTLFSVKDLRTYNINDVFGKTENNIDMKFYMFGSAATPRILTMDGGSSDNKNTEYTGANGTNADQFTTKNATRFLKLPGSFDFDKATVADIQAISKASISISNMNPANAGDVIAFKTGATSAVGGDKVGIIKITKTEVINPAASANRGLFTISVKFLNQ